MDGDPVPGADKAPSWIDRAKAKMPKMPEIDRKKAGSVMKTTGKCVLYGAGGAFGAIFFLAKPLTTILVGGGLVVAGKAIESGGEVEEATAEVAAAAAG